MLLEWLLKICSWLWRLIRDRLRGMIHVNSNQKLRANDKDHDQYNENSLGKGVITYLSDASGVIDSKISFDSKAAGDIFHKLTIGCKVEYLATQKDGDDVPTVVKVRRTVEFNEEEEFEEVPVPSEPALTLAECQSVSLFGENFVITTQMRKICHISMDLHNNEKYTLRLKSVEMVPPKVGKSQVTALLPLAPIGIPTGGKTMLAFRVFTMFKGKTTENFEMVFDKFKIRHSITVIVYGTEQEVHNAKKLGTTSFFPSDSTAAPRRTPMQAHRAIANKVWSRSGDVVPGECVGVKRRFVATHLAGFEVPEKLREIYLTIARPVDMYRAIEENYPFLKERLSIKNYADNFSLFLYLEEIENFVLVRIYDTDRAKFQHDGEFLALHIPNLADRRPSLVIGDLVHAINPLAGNNNNRESNMIFEGIVHKVLQSRVLLKFNADFHKNYRGEEYRLEFHLSRYNLRKQHHAISKVVTHMGENFLFPIEVTKRLLPRLEVRMDDQDNMCLYDSKLKWFNPSLNPIQKQAVFNILRGETDNMPYVIFGPPGTGKTMTVVEAILQVVENVPYAKILVGTPSNNAADLITRKIIQSNVLPKDEFIRLVSVNQIEKDLIPPDVVRNCVTVDIGTPGSCENSMIITASGMKLRCQRSFISSHRVTISTNATLGNFMQMDFPDKHFTHVFIDEAGQCTEPETMVPISLLREGNNFVVLAGDPHQLQAIVVNRFSCRSGYSNSFLERLLGLPPYIKNTYRFPNTSGYNPLCLTKLLNNYRSLPSIMINYSHLFYDSELIPMVSETDSREMEVLKKAIKVFNPAKNISTRQGAFFFGIEGKNLQENGSTSWYNPQEAAEVYKTTLALYGINIKPDQIGIIAPYAKQVKTLKSLFKTNSVDAPKIGSVEEFQGQERDIILISLVRSSELVGRCDPLMKLGFVRCGKRMNVAISRARAMMVVFGNPKVLSLDKSWRCYIAYCVNNNAVFGTMLNKEKSVSFYSID